MLFGGLAATIAIFDQLIKIWVLASFETGRLYPVWGDWIRIDFIHNNGGLFGMFQGAAPVLALATVGAVAIIGWMQLSFGWRSWLMTLALGLLLGGAIGNFIDRIRFGYVLDFVDIGVGTWRWYIFNLADSAVTGFFILMVVMLIFTPRILAGAEDKAAEGSNAAEGSAGGTATK